MDLFDTDSILPPDPDDMAILHDREYRVRAYRKAADRIVIRGAVRDQKPPGLYLAGDPDPLTIHHMQLDMEISFPTTPKTNLRGRNCCYQLRCRWNSREPIHTHHAN